MMLKKWNWWFFTLSAVYFSVTKSLGEEMIQQRNIADHVGEIINRKLEPLHNKIAAFEEKMNAKMENITDFEYNLNEKIRELSNNILLEQTTNITKEISQIIKSNLIEKKILELTEQIDHKLSVMKNDMELSIITKLEKIPKPGDICSTKVKEIADKILFKQTMNVTQQGYLKNLSASEKKQLLTLLEEKSNGLTIKAKLKQLENNTNQEMKKLADKLDSLALGTDIISKKLNHVGHEKAFLEAIGMTNSHLNLLENKTHLDEHNIRKLRNISEEIQTSVEKLNQKLVNLKNDDADMDLKLKQSIVRIINDQLNNLTQQFTIRLSTKENTILQSIEGINKKLEIIERVPKLDDHVDDSIKISQKTQLFLEKTNEAVLVLKNMTAQNQCVQEVDVFTYFCNITLQSSLYKGGDVWKYYNPPTEDRLDKTLANITRCRYAAGRYRAPFKLLASYSKGSKPLEWRFAIRARDFGQFNVEWDQDGDREGYSFRIGAQDNSVLNIMRRGKWGHWDYSTPNVLSQEIYVPFHVRIEGGNITFRLGCERTPMFSAPVAIPAGGEVRAELIPYNYYGAKFLYSCPATVAVRTMQ